MHKTAFAELVSNLRALTPQQLAQLGAAVTDSQRASILDVFAEENDELFASFGMENTYRLS